MDKITIKTDEFGIEIVTIDKGNDEWVTMAKSTYDAQQEHLTENPTEDVE